MTQEAIYPLSCIYKRAGNSPAQLVVPFTLLDILSVDPSYKIGLNKELIYKLATSKQNYSETNLKSFLSHGKICRYPLALDHWNLIEERKREYNFCLANIFPGTMRRHVVHLLLFDPKLIV